MSFNDLAMLTARKCGSYEALAGMMVDSIRDLDSDSEFTRDWALTRLKSLAEQFEKTVEEFEKEVDTA
jgi:hypothetical protein